MSLPIAGVDHVVIYATDIEATIAFFERVLGAVKQPPPHLVDGRLAVQRLAIGKTVFSVHQAGGGARPIAANPAVGAADICLEWIGDIEAAVAHLRNLQVEIIEGPCARRANDGAPARSIYFRDPDGNLLELLARI